jgi:hypothetical protein
MELRPRLTLVASLRADRFGHFKPRGTLEDWGLVDETTSTA